VDVFLLKNQTVMKRYIKGIDKYDHRLKSLSTWWEKIALIGKINSFEVASTILEDMDHTLVQFHQLQKRLIENLTNEHARKVVTQDLSRCQMAIDVLIRNLFERTADIGFLATDHDLVQFLNNSNKKEEDVIFLRQRLQAYIDIYSVYSDVVLVGPDGELIFQLSQSSRSGKVQDDMIRQALECPDHYVEYFGKTDLMGEPQENLLYANAVVNNDGLVVGVIVLCFRFQNELEGITNNLLFELEENHFLLLNGAGDVLFAPQTYQHDTPTNLSLSASPKIVSIDHKEKVQVTTKGQSYQGYTGPENWHMGSLMALENIERGASETSAPQVLLTDLAGLISADLFDIRHQSIAINDDLELIVLNGIITAARKESVEFMPVLEAIKQIGRDIDNVFEDSIESLFSTIIYGQLNALRLQASLAVDIMDRNLFERANDCRWWGLSTLLKTALSAPEVDKSSIQKTLEKIHSLYTVYHILYVYDQDGRYIAFSDSRYEDRVGQPIEGDSGGLTVFQLEDIYAYCVSPFVPFDCYDGEHSYIYNAAIRSTENNKEVIGGIGLVFDSTAEFNAILNDILLSNNDKLKEGSKALFTTDEGLVIASSSADHAIGSIFFPTVNMTELYQTGTTATAIQLDDHAYLVGAAKSNGYREYKRQDGYDNTVIAWVLSPC